MYIYLPLDYLNSKINISHKVKVEKGHEVKVKGREVKVKGLEVKVYQKLRALLIKKPLYTHSHTIKKGLEVSKGLEVLKDIEKNKKYLRIVRKFEPFYILRALSSSSPYSLSSTGLKPISPKL